LAFGTLVSHASQFAKAPKAAKIAVTLAGVLGVSLVAGQFGGSPTAHAASAFSYQRGYSVQHGWLCYGWANGVYHCTAHWKVSSGHYVSLNSAWVPSSGAATGGGSGSTGGGSGHYATGGGSTGGSTSAAPRGISPWAYTGRPAYSMGNTGAYSQWFGNCTWYAWYRHQNEPLMGLGNAGQWAYTAGSRGLRTGTTPAAGATVVFQGGAQGAGSVGHVAHVEAVYGNGWFLVSEMNFYWNGGGWGRVDYRYAHTGAGVSFIY
jgi:surface antigen